VLAGSTLLAKFSRLEAVFAVQYKLQTLAATITWE
jgi:hypothetical protein